MKTESHELSLLNAPASLPSIAASPAQVNPVSSRPASVSTRPALRRISWGLAVPLGLALLWCATVDTGLVRNPLLVPLGKILSAPFTDPQGQHLWSSLIHSLPRLAIGLLLGSLAGILLGVVLGLARTARRTVAPTVHALRQIALFAWIPLLSTWLGNGEAAKVAFIALGAFFPVYLNTEQGLRQLPQGWNEAAQIMHLSYLQRLRYLVLPAALPAILMGLEMALVIAWIGTVGAEYALGTGRGIGNFLLTARENFRMDLVLAGVLTLALTGAGLHLLAKRGFQRLIFWERRA